MRLVSLQKNVFMFGDMCYSIVFINILYMNILDMDRYGIFIQKDPECWITEALGG